MVQTESFNERYRRIYERSGTRLCIGLDADVRNLPESVMGADDPLLEFNTKIIEATSDLCCAYKPNLAFYESSGEAGIRSLVKTLERIPGEVLTIGDAKRGDLGNTAERYAYALFNQFGFDAATVNPYQGMDALEPFFKYPGKCVFVLALTSNPGSADFQRLMIDGRPLYMHVIDKCMATYGSTGSLGFVVGATHPVELAEIRNHVGSEIPLLIPGLGAQGGDAEANARANNGGVGFFNVSRGVIGVSKGADFADRAREAAAKFVEELQEQTV